MTIQFQCKFAFSILTGVLASAAGNAIELDNPIDLQSVTAIERALAVVFVEDDTIYQLPDRKSYFITTPFKVGGKTREEIFGEQTDSKRIEIGSEGEKERPWRGGAAVGDVILFLDGVTLEVVAYSKKTQAFLSRHSIVWDNLRPPRDRGGEAGSPETTAFRKKFYLAMAKADPSKFVGMTAVPEKWRETSEPEFFISTRVADFPLLTMSCTKDDLSRCRIRRACFVENLKAPVDDAVGVGVIESKRLLLIGDRKMHGAHVLKYNSCLDVRAQVDISFPKRVFEVSNLYVDRAQRLWVTSIRPDDYFNATTFYWDISAKIESK